MEEDKRLTQEKFTPGTREIFFLVRTVKHREWLPREIIQVPFMEDFKEQLGSSPEQQALTPELTLLGWRIPSNLYTLLFVLLLIIYPATVFGNILIVVLVMADQHLHTPMYFFLGNLSCLETCYSSNILPWLLASFLTGDKTISAPGCMAQFYFFSSFAGTWCYLLAAMSYDRYLAIGQPLLYASLMTWRAIDHFFCDFSPLLELSCSDTRVLTQVALTFGFLHVGFPFLFTLASHVCITAAILRIPSRADRQKAFPTCSSHLTVVTVFYGTLITVYMLPRTAPLRQFNKAFSFFYTILTPLVNFLTYSLRNMEVREALWKVLRKAKACTQSSWQERDSRDKPLAGLSQGQALQPECISRSVCL
ncbi:olfactory receptor 5AP2-like [Gavia stellata]|uniref:olfactory receptor 5AP2-like n=1 Tax=Gavia stellata TaxID=37040 RepID=UPI0028A2278C|nr:olfactory receptor 5AP2-like [Gavia stellata]